MPQKLPNPPPPRPFPIREPGGVKGNVNPPTTGSRPPPPPPPPAKKNG